MRRGQILGQVFILILAAVIFILILVYGYRAISQFTKRSEQVALVDFENQFRNAAKSISLDFGSVKRLDLRVPAAQEICVMCTPGLDVAGCSPSQQSMVDFQQDHPLLYESWQGGSQNVFLIPLAETPLLIERIEAVGGAFCMPVVGGSVSLRLEGRGDRALVGPWPTVA
ncbi:hypothetical protein HY493_02265 [Candidatus Woesearchaeota archaeon]|nr:hypothetical protein [Candidatus Woesearchaeota archaeon]